MRPALLIAAILVAGLALAGFEPARGQSCCQDVVLLMQAPSVPLEDPGRPSVMTNWDADWGVAHNLDGVEDVDEVEPAEPARCVLRGPSACKSPWRHMIAQGAPALLVPPPQAL